MSSTSSLAGMLSRCILVTVNVGLLDEAGTHFLNRHEIARSQCMVRAEDRRRFVAGATLLRLVVARLIGGEPSGLVVDRRCSSCGGLHGKPSIPLSGLYVSVSHSSDTVQVACTGAGQVGTDVQDRRSTDAVSALLEHQESVLDFLIAWTRLEAVVKATGEGFRVPPEQVRLSAPRDVPKLFSYRGRDLPCVLHDQTPCREYVGSVAVLTADDVVFVEIPGDRFLS